MQLSRLEEVAGANVSRETWASVQNFIEMLLEENARQNLISRSTEADIFERHIVDGAQLLPLAPSGSANWIDIGTGPGLPGIVLALLAPQATFTLVEPRPLRIQFLERAVKELRLDERVRLVEGKSHDVNGSFDVITGRAVANLSKFLKISHHLSTEKSVWVLPKGRKALDELEEARRFWHLDHTIVPRVTDEDASIVRITRATQRKRGGKK